MVMTIVVNLQLVVATLLECHPISNFWRHNTSVNQGGTCQLNMLPIAGYVHSAINICTDIILAGVPIAIVARTQLTRSKKIITAGILILGARSVHRSMAITNKVVLIFFDSVCIFTIARLNYLYAVATKNDLCK